MCVNVHDGVMDTEEKNVLSFRPSLKLEKALKSTQAEVVNIFSDLDSVDQDEKHWLHKWALISTVGGSTRIENAILTDAEIEWVDTTLSAVGYPSSFESQKKDILDKLSKDHERSVEEVIGCREVLSLVYMQATELFPLSEGTIRHLHRTLLNFYPSAEHYAGKYKTSPNQVVSMNHETGTRRIVLDPTPPGPQTSVAMKDLVEWYNSALKQHPWPLLVATEFVFRFLAIHPFQDGNGRLGRALFLMAMLQSDDPAMNAVMQFISIDRQIERHRPLYYSVLNQTSGGKYRSDLSEYNLEPLAWFFLKMMDKSIGDIKILREKYRSFRRLSENALNILACFKASPERKLKLSDLMKETTLGRRTVQNILVKITSLGFIQQIGSGPSTRYQLIF